MPVSDQGINLNRYMLIPRTAIFVRRGNSYLLLKGSPTKRLWAEKYNGLGGHVDSGQNPGICLYVFSGECEDGDPKPSEEGAAEWVPFEALGDLPVVEDLPALLRRIHAMSRGDDPFAARSYYDDQDKLILRFGE